MWGLGGAGGILAAGGLGPAFAGVFGLRLESGYGVGLRLAALLPLINNGLTAREDEVEVSVRTFSAEVEYTRAIAQSWMLAAGLGAGVVWLALRPEAEAPVVARDRRLMSGLYFLHLGVSRELTDWLGLRAGAAVGVSGPRPVLQFDGREVGSWGPGFGSSP